MALPAVLVAAPTKPADKDKPAVGAPVGKSASACPAKMLPLVLNNTWTYSKAAANNPAPEQIAKIAPAQPDTIKITVKAIDKKGTDTVVTLEEVVTYPGKAAQTPKKTGKDAPKGDKDKPASDAKPEPIVRTLSTTITCSPTRFDISPESFWFAAEPGGFYGMTLDKIDRKNTSWKVVNGNFADDKWEEDLKIDWSRQPTKGTDAKLGGGKLELERVYTPGQTEIITSLNTTVTGPTGNWKADILFLVTTGRVTLDNAGPEDKPAELPAGWTTQMWTFPNVGIVKTLNPYAHAYVLTDATLY